MPAPNNYRNFLVNPGFELSPIPEEDRSSSDSGSLPELVVEPAPNRHDDPPEFYEGLERRMKQYYRRLFLGAHGSDDDTDDTPVHVHNTEFWSVSPIDDNMTTSNWNKRETAPTDENPPVKSRKRLTKGADGSDDDTDDTPVHVHNTEFWSVSPIDVNIENDDMTTSNLNKQKTAPTDENPPVKSRKRLTKGAVGSDDDTDDTPVHVYNTEFWSVSPVDVNLEDDNMTTSNLNKRETAPTDENPPVKSRKRLTKGADGSDDDTDDTPVHVHNTEFWSVSPIDLNIEDDNMTTSNMNKRETAPTDGNPPVKSRKRLTKGAHGSEDDISSDFEVNRSMASTFKDDIDTRKGDSIGETQIITSINSDDDYDESGDDKLIDTCATYSETSHISIDDSNKSSSTVAHSESYETDVDANVNENNQDNTKEEIIDNKSFSDVSTQDFHRVSTTIAQIHEPRPERPQMADGGSPSLMPRLIRTKRAVFRTNCVGRHSGQSFDVSLPSDEITKTFSRQSFEDIEPVEMMRAAVESRGNVSWHGEETSQASPTLAFEAPTSAKGLQDISTDSYEMNASHEESQAEFSEDSRVFNKRKTAPTAENPPVKKKKDAAEQRSVEERKKWSHLNSNFFIGTPLVFRLCRCPDHECSVSTKY